MVIYTILKTLHILGAVVFVGNIVVTALWKALADRTRDPRVVAFGQRLVTVTDWTFTGPGAALVLLTGILLSSQGAYWRLPWIHAGLGLFALSGILWLAVLAPIQHMQPRLVRDLQDGPIPSDYWRLGRIWILVGIPATLLPLANIWVMVAKPS